MKKFNRRVVRETQAHIGEVLIQDGGPKKTSHLLLFDRVAGRCEDMPAPREDRAGYLTVEGREERELALFKGELCVGAAELDAVGAGDFVGGGRVGAQGV